MKQSRSYLAAIVLLIGLSVIFVSSGGLRLQSSADQPTPQQTADPASSHYLQLINKLMVESQTTDKTMLHLPGSADKWLQTDAPDGDPTITRFSLNPSAVGEDPELFADPDNDLLQIDVVRLDKPADQTAEQLLKLETAGQGLAGSDWQLVASPNGCSAASDASLTAAEVAYRVVGDTVQAVVIRIPVAPLACDKLFDRLLRQILALPQAASGQTSSFSTASQQADLTILLDRAGTDTLTPDQLQLKLDGQTIRLVAVLDLLKSQPDSPALSYYREYTANPLTEATWFSSADGNTPLVVAANTAALVVEPQATIDNQPVWPPVLQLSGLTVGSHRLMIGTEKGFSAELNVQVTDHNTKSMTTPYGQITPTWAVLDSQGNILTETTLELK